MDKKDFFYELPKHLIAQQPIERRDGSRLMLLDRQTGAVQHKMFTDIVSLLRAGDCIVINDSKVIPARLMSENGVEFLLHERIENNRWTTLTKPGKKAQIGDELIFGGGRLKAKILDIIEGGLRTVALTHEGELEPLLEEIGEMPLPHYIEEKQTDTARYQTVYAKADDAGASVAAPTAGLHFTQELLDDIQKAGANIARVTLHVGIGTFRPVKTDDITRHEMHSEYCRISPETADLLNQTKRNGGRIIAIGTTSCRTLESRVTDSGQIQAGAGKTDIFIYPGYTFRAIDGLLTNFHLPESTLIMLVSALAGREHTLKAYEEAVREEYRFFSYGDAMLIANH
ncbi:MAG: tRNA preQ1(34) S-adenosylmethionine ribosyltransferase-isomerase QueA [Defluviitaleaceae bacterium]|nr:tRNA preQ1(34) S-adenosylmethionine ribosyltransferase-isomerase QueA [Defluviitaleaceae bacterium]MCL2274572.1 tRNA preQ1(34) S-adenosylmethionine ribosyltransferase-isomerase QueA [Defluviitaleaceae bacterium]